MKKPKHYYRFEQPLVDRESFFDEAFQKELLELLETLPPEDPKENATKIFKQFRSRYRMIPRW